MPDPLFAIVQRSLAGQYSLKREIGRGGMGSSFSHAKSSWVV